MAVVALVSIKGSPGVTTAALALAGAWRSRPCVLLECDPAGGDLAPSLGLPVTPGLVSLAATVRQSPDPAQVGQHAATLPSGLRVVVAPVGAEQARVTVDALGQSQLVASLAHASDVAAVADGGRLDPESPVMPVLRQATVVLVCLRPRRSDLAHLAPRAETLRDLPGAGLVLIGPGEFSGAEISGTLRMPIAVHLPKDPHGARLLLSAGLRKGTAMLPLVRAARSFADRLAVSPALDSIESSSTAGDARPGQRLVPPAAWGTARPLPAKAGGTGCE